jgi:hypothetical protein
VLLWGIAALTITRAMVQVSGAGLASSSLWNARAPMLDAKVVPPMAAARPSRLKKKTPASREAQREAQRETQRPAVAQEPSSSVPAAWPARTVTVSASELYDKVTYDSPPQHDDEEAVRAAAEAEAAEAMEAAKRQQLEERQAVPALLLEVQQVQAERPQQPARTVSAVAPGGMRLESDDSDDDLPAFDLLGASSRPAATNVRAAVPTPHSPNPCDLCVSGGFASCVTQRGRRVREHGCVWRG